MHKPFSQACENNKDPILSVLNKFFANSHHVLEIGSGTGQHAVYFAKHLSHLIWQTSDVKENHSGIELWINSEEELSLDNLKSPLEINMHSDIQALSEKLAKDIDATFSANTLHIMSWPLAKKCIVFCASILPKNGYACFYGPFNYQGKYTSASNENFDHWLQQRDAKSAIRDYEKVIDHAQQHNLTLIEDVAMPANNRLLVFQKTY